MRMDSFGKDKDGNVYYCQVDEKANIKVYQENQDEESWTVVASNREELAILIEELKGNRPIRPLSKDLIDEDSSSNSRPSDKEEKIELKPAEQEYSIDNASHEFPLKQTIRLVKKAELPSEPEALPEGKEEKPEEAATNEKEPEIELPERTIQKKRRRK